MAKAKDPLVAVNQSAAEAVSPVSERSDTHYGGPALPAFMQDWKLSLRDCSQDMYLSSLCLCMRRKELAQAFVSFRSASNEFVATKWYHTEILVLGSSPMSRTG